jgi:hypothetical protein
MAFEVVRAPTYKLLGRAALTTNFTTSSTHTTQQDEGLSVSVTYNPSRILRVTLQVSAGASGGAQGVVYRVLRTSTVVNAWTNSRALSTVFGDAMTYTCTFAGPATGGTETFKVQIAALSNNTAVNSYGNATEPRVLTVEDIGPQ